MKGPGTYSRNSCEVPCPLSSTTNLLQSLAACDTASPLAPSPPVPQCPPCASHRAPDTQTRAVVHLDEIHVLSVHMSMPNHRKKRAQPDPTPHPKEHDRRVGTLQSHCAASSANARHGSSRKRPQSLFTHSPLEKNQIGVRPVPLSGVAVVARTKDVRNSERLSDFLDEKECAIPSRIGTAHDLQAAWKVQRAVSEFVTRNRESVAPDLPLRRPKSEARGTKKAGGSGDH